MDKGAVGGGAMIWFEGPLPLYAYILNPIACLLCKAVGFTGGAFIFCTSEAFRKTGGFDERLFCGEENVMVLELKKQGRFVVSWEGVRTSAGGSAPCRDCARWPWLPASSGLPSI